MRVRGETLLSGARTSSATDSAAAPSQRWQRACPRGRHWARLRARMPLPAHV